jgi:hypothetical protein
MALLLAKPKECTCAYNCKFVNIFFEVLIFSILRLKNLYHTLSVLNGTIGFELFMKIIEYCGTTNNSQTIDELFPDIDKMLKEFGSSIEQTRNTYKLFRDTFKNNKELSYKWAVKYLTTFDSNDILTIDLSNESCQIIIDAIKINNLFQLDNLLEINSIKQLEKTKPKVYQLLKIFVTENLDSFKLFINENNDFLKTTGN